MAATYITERLLGHLRVMRERAVLSARLPGAPADVRERLARMERELADMAHKLTTERLAQAGIAGTEGRGSHEREEARC